MVFLTSVISGGRADGEEDHLSVALKKAKEESGVVDVRSLSKGIISLEVLTVKGREKRKLMSPFVFISISPIFWKRTR